MNNVWASKGLRACFLLPVSWVFQALVHFRQQLYRSGVLTVQRFSVPVIVVGNISVGGTGKTPMVSAVVERLLRAGRNPGIVSRGYGAQPASEPRAVGVDTPVALAGDEPALLARLTGAPVCIGADRSAAVQFLIAHHAVDVVVSDDGMQHYAMSRDVEIAVVDGARKFGNGWLLPAGPLREPVSRLSRVNIIAVQQSAGANETNAHDSIEQTGLPSLNPSDVGHFMLAVSAVQKLSDGQASSLVQFEGQTVHAVAGLGNPQRFFDSLQQAGMNVIEHGMPDHHRYSADDITFNDHLPIFVTSKDAVKLRELNVSHLPVFEVCVNARLDDALDQALHTMIADLA